MVNVFDLGYMDVEKDFFSSKYHRYQIKRKETGIIFNRRKKSITKAIQKKRIVISGMYIPSLQYINDRILNQM